MIRLCESMAVLFITLTLFIHLISISDAGLPEFAVTGRCPDNYENEYCSCDINDASLSTTINCNNLENSEKLKKALDFKWNNVQFDWFVLENSTITSFSDEIFNNLSFKGFIMSYNTIEDMDDNFFAGSESSCEYIWMSDNTFTTDFNFKSITNLTNLASISILSSNMTTIPDSAFGNLPKLETIVLQTNGINTLGQHAFSKLPRLRRLDLSWNNLTKLINNSINTAHASRPVAITLVHNNISTVETDAFNHLTSYYVNLKYNNLETLKEDAFSPLLSRMIRLRGSKLFVDGNPIVCDKSINWLDRRPSEYREQVHGLTCIDRPSINRNNVIHKS